MRPAEHLPSIPDPRTGVTLRPGSQASRVGLPRAQYEVRVRPSFVRLPRRTPRPR
jgi:hypothetical protein